MRNYKYILLVFACCISFLQLKADNFSGKTDNTSGIETKIYPNPVVNGENITIKGVKDFEKIEVINIVGKEIFSEKLTPASVYEVNINGFDEGIYLLKIFYTDNTSIIKRFWVK
jgi:hypothetical protein